MPRDREGDDEDEDEVESDDELDLEDILKHIAEDESAQFLRVGRSWTERMPDQEWESYQGALEQYRQENEEQRARRSACVERVMMEHGVPVHFTVLARMVEAKYPGLFPNARSLMMFMIHFGGPFDNRGRGVFACRRPASE